MKERSSSWMFGLVDLLILVIPAIFLCMTTTWEGQWIQSWSWNRRRGRRRRRRRRRRSR
jgi:hypothetical protein